MASVALRRPRVGWPNWRDARDWATAPVRALASWNAALARLDAQRDLPRRRQVVDISVLGLAGLGIVALALWMGRWQVLYAHPRPFAAALAAELALYAGAALWVARRKPDVRWALAAIALIALAARLAFVWQAPTASDDIYRYVWDGRVQAQGINPYRYAPSDPTLASLRDGAIYTLVNRRQVPTIYPPVAQVVFRVVYALHPDSVAWTKLAFVGFDMASIALIAGLLMRLGLRPERVLLYAWHPLLILELGHSGHVDIVAIFFLLLALRARVGRQALRTGAFLACATLVKFYALVALPALLFREVRKDARAIGGLTITAMLAYLPFLSVGGGVFGYLQGYTREEGLASGQRFFLLTQARQLARAVPTLADWPAVAPFGAARAFQGAVLLVMAGLALWCWRARETGETDVAARAALLFATLLVLTTPTYPWYTLLLLPLVPFLRGRLLVPTLTIVGLAGLLYLQWWWPGSPRWPIELVYGAGAVSLALVACWTTAEKLARARWGAHHTRYQPTAVSAVPCLRVAPERLARRPVIAAPADSPSLFDCFPWLYAFCRERLFRDHTRLIVAGLWPDDAPRPGSEVLEIGCGPGWYARRLAARRPCLHAVGIDCSWEQLRHARARAAAQGLDNCHFQHADARRLPRAAGTVDAIVVSRLFTVLPERACALAEMHRVLREDGRCFIAEPRSELWTAVPLRALWLMAGVTAALRRRPTSYREPRRATVLSAGEFDALIASQPWRTARVWRDRQYQYAVCVKGGATIVASARDMAAD